MNHINKIIAERKIISFEEAAEALQVTDEWQEIAPLLTPVGVAAYLAPNGRAIPVFTHLDGTQEIPVEGDLFNFPKELMDTAHLVKWVRHCFPSVLWFVDNKGQRTCIRTGRSLQTV